MSLRVELFNKYYYSNKMKQNKIVQACRKHWTYRVNVECLRNFCYTVPHNHHTFTLKMASAMLVETFDAAHPRKRKFEYSSPSVE